MFQALPLLVVPIVMPVPVLLFVPLVPVLITCTSLMPVLKTPLPLPNVLPGLPPLPLVSRVVLSVRPDTTLMPPPKSVSLVQVLVL